MGVNVFELFAKLGLDTKDYEKGLADSESKTQKFANALGNGLKTAAKVGVAAITVASTAVVALTKQSIESYAEYEQLVGGAQLMFGDAYDTIAEKAENAYATVQMSQNEYLKQVNGFATGLKTALDGNEQAAAELADRIITAEADIIAATGNAAENVQAAFNGIMKSNFTMLDNLQIGITPTKEGFQEVIDKVNDWNAANGKATKYQMGNLADMQSALVDYIDMVGMSGYAQREASQTIQGSLSSTKAAWSNLITGLADDNADFEKLTEDLVNSLVGDGTEQNPGVFGNILPRIEVIFGGIGDLIAQLAPHVVVEIPKLIESVLPTMITAVVGLVSVIGSTLSENAPMLLQSALDLISSLGGALVENAPMLISTVLSMVTQLATWLGENAGTFAQSAIDLIVGLSESLVTNLPQMIPAIISIITGLVTTLTKPENLAMLLDAALAIILAIAEGLIQSLPDLLVACLDILGNIVSFFTDEENKEKVKSTALELGRRLVEGIWEGIKAMGSWIKEKIFGWFDGLVEDVQEDQEIHSPSRLWARVIGKPVGQGVGVGAVDGLEESEKMIQDKLDNMVADVESRTVEVTPKIETATATGAVSGVDFNALASSSIDGIASIAKSVDYNALVSALIEAINVLVDLFTSGEAKVGVDNTRDLRRALNA